MCSAGGGGLGSDGWIPACEPFLSDAIHSKMTIRNLIWKAREVGCAFSPICTTPPAACNINNHKVQMIAKKGKCEMSKRLYLNPPFSPPPSPQHAKVLRCKLCALTFLITIFFPWAVSLHRILEELLNPIKVYILQQTGWSNKGESAEMGLHPSIRSLLAADADFTTGNVISWQEQKQKSSRVWCGDPSPLSDSPLLTHPPPLLTWTNSSCSESQI